MKEAGLTNVRASINRRQNKVAQYMLRDRFWNFARERRRERERGLH